MASMCRLWFPVSVRYGATCRFPARTPRRAALMMQLGSEGVFVGSGIFKSGDPAKRARAIVQAVTYYNDPVKLAELSENLGEAMSGLEIKTLENKYAERGW